MLSSKEGSSLGAFWMAERLTVGSWASVRDVARDAQLDSTMVSNRMQVSRDVFTMKLQNSLCWQ